MLRKHPEALGEVMDYGAHASLVHSVVGRRPHTGGMLVSHFEDPEMTKAALMGIAQVYSKSNDPHVVVSSIRTVIDRGTASCSPTGQPCSMPLRCPSVESAKMLCAWRCIHAKNDADWQAWSRGLIRDLNPFGSSYRPAFRGGRDELRHFVMTLTTLRPLLLQSSSALTVSDPSAARTTRSA